MKFTYPSGLWTRTLDDLRARNPKDPVNVIFERRDILATEGLLVGLILGGFRLGPIDLVDRFGRTRIAGDQWFVHDQQGQHRHDASLGTHRQLIPLAGRLHIRIYDPGVRRSAPSYTAGAVHGDAAGLAWPPDIATTFDGARDELAAVLASQAPSIAITWIRSRDRSSSVQLNGSVVTTDGFVLVAT